jgi:xylose dehydrogenase (NAD/NADP)
MKKLRWGLLSTARINRALIPAIRASQHSELAAVASRSQETAIQYARKEGISQAFGSYDDLLADPNIDVIYNPLPNHLHADWTIRAVQSGKHVLTEKPLALTAAEVDAIDRAARSTGKIVAEAFMYRHDPKTLKVQDLIANGAVGEVRTIQGMFSFPLDRPGDIRWQPDMGGGSLWDIGCYPISYSHMIAGGPPEQVFGWQKTSASGVDVDFTGQMKYPGGITAQFFSSFALPQRTLMEIHGTHGTLSIPMPFIPRDPAVGITLHTGKGQETFSFAAHEVYLGEVEDMENAILFGTKPRISLEVSGQNVQTILSLYHSAAIGQVVNVP